MALNDIDFDGTDVVENNVSNNDDSSVSDNKDDVTHLHGTDVDELNSDSEENEVIDEVIEEAENEDDNSSTGELTVGDQIEYDGVTYTIVDNGDLVDDKGNVFKEAKDVADFLANSEIEDSEDSFDINELRDELGVELKDENGNDLSFDNTPDGIKNFVNSVIETKSNEIQEATLNRFYSANPMVKQFVDYVQLTGTPRGFGEIPDRSGITVEQDNEPQQIAIIKMAANEFGNKTINDDYINWLRDSGSLYNYAKEQLKALVDKDKAVREDIETRAAQQREEETARLNEYWNKVRGVINSRVIGSYKIPENFTRVVDGRKVMCNSDDFFDYIANARYEDEQGNRMTGYTKSLQSLTDEEYLNRELLDAWLMFTGGSYKDLVDMAIKENEVRKLVVRSKQNRSAKTVRVVKRQEGKASIDDIIL